MNDKVTVTGKLVDITVQYEGHDVTTKQPRYIYHAVFTDHNARHDAWGYGDTVEAAVADLYIGLQLAFEEEADAAWASNIEL